MNSTRFAIGSREYIIIKSRNKNQSIEKTLEQHSDFREKIAIEIIRQNFPIRGAEVSFIRKAIGLSLSKVAGKLELSKPAILKWERKPNERLALVNEVAFRVFIAELLDLEFETKLSCLRSSIEDTVDLIVEL